MTYRDDLCDLETTDLKLIPNSVRATPTAA